MRFVRDWIRGLGLVALVCSLGTQLSAVEEYFWPTPNTAFVEGKGIERFVQPTVSGVATSGLFGCVRNDGKRFHEGLDLKPISLDRNKEPTDQVYAFSDGVVRHVSREAKLSSYGRYIVIEHTAIAPGVVSLYAHLKSIPADVVPGEIVKGGHVIGMMGRSASYSIPRSRAHLHFEVGLWEGDDFQLWYDAQKFDSANDHGVYNGMNIIGIDVWRFWKAYKNGEVSSVLDFIRSEPVALTVEVPYAEVPELVKGLPQDFVLGLGRGNRAGWRIGFTWYGAPVRWDALSRDELTSRGVKVVEIDAAALGRLGCDNMVSPDGSPGSRLRSVLSRLFIKSGAY